MPTREFHNVSEINVIKQGYILLSENLKSEGDLFDFPKRKNGTSLFLRQGWYQRVLNNEVKLDSCPGNDVLAAQSDVKYLSLIQCLWIRRLNVNSCESECSNFQAHTSFFESIDQKICLSLGLRVLKDLDIEAPVDNSTPRKGLVCSEQRAVMHLGQKIVLFSGAYNYLLKDEKDKKRKNPLPRAFAFEVDTMAFSYRAAKYIAFFFPAITKTSRGPEGVKTVLVVRDFSRDTIPRMITWDIADIVLKKDCENQVKKELDRDPKSVENLRKSKSLDLKYELHDVMEARKLRSEGSSLSLTKNTNNPTKESPSAESLRRLRELYNVRRMTQDVEQLIAIEGEKANDDQKLRGLKKRSQLMTYGYQTKDGNSAQGQAELDAFLQEYGLDALMEGTTHNPGDFYDDEDYLQSPLPLLLPSDSTTTTNAGESDTSSIFPPLTPRPRSRSFSSSLGAESTYAVATITPRLEDLEHLEDLQKPRNEAVLTPKGNIPTLRGLPPHYDVNSAGATKLDDDDLVLDVIFHPQETRTMDDDDAAEKKGDESRAAQDDDENTRTRGDSDVISPDVTMEKEESLLSLETDGKRRSVSDRRKATESERELELELKLELVLELELEQEQELELEQEAGDEADEVFLLEDSIPTPKEERVKYADPAGESEESRCWSLPSHAQDHSGQDHEESVVLVTQKEGMEKDEDTMKESTEEERATESGDDERAQKDMRNRERAEVKHVEDDGEYQENEEDEEMKHITTRLLETIYESVLSSLDSGSDGDRTYAHSSFITQGEESKASSEAYDVELNDINDAKNRQKEENACIKSEQEQDASITTSLPMAPTLLEEQSRHDVGDDDDAIIRTHDGILRNADATVIHDTDAFTHDESSSSSSYVGDTSPSASVSLSIESSSRSGTQRNTSPRIIITPRLESHSTFSGNGDRKSTRKPRALGVIPTPQTMLGVLNAASTSNRVVETNNEGCPNKLGNFSAIRKGPSEEQGQKHAKTHAKIGEVTVPPHSSSLSKEPIPLLQIPKNPNPLHHVDDLKEAENEDDANSTIASCSSSGALIQEERLGTSVVAIDSPFFPQKKVELSRGGTSVLEGFRDIVRASREKRKKRAKKMAAAAAELKNHQEGENVLLAFLEPPLQQDPVLDRDSKKEKNGSRFEQDGSKLRLLRPVKHTAADLYRKDVGKLQADVEKMIAMLQTTSFKTAQEAHMRRTRNAIVAFPDEEDRAGRRGRHGHQTRVQIRGVRRGGRIQAREYHHRRRRGLRSASVGEKCVRRSSVWTMANQVMKCLLAVLPLLVFLPASVSLISETAFQLP